MTMTMMLMVLRVVAHVVIMSLDDEASFGNNHQP
jgi:hypothetical protein